MICENLTIGTRHDFHGEKEEIHKACSNLRYTLAAQISAQLHSAEVVSILKNEFQRPIPRLTHVKSVVRFISKEDKILLSERMMKVREDQFPSVHIEDSKKSKKVMESLLEFEDRALSEKLVDSEKLILFRRLCREILKSSLQSEEIFKFTHLESIVASIAMTAASLMELSIKMVFGILEQMFGKKLKLSKIRRSKGFELMKKVKIRVWDVY